MDGGRVEHVAEQHVAVVCLSFVLSTACGGEFGGGDSPHPLQRIREKLLEDARILEDRFVAVVEWSRDDSFVPAAGLAGAATLPPHQSRLNSPEFGERENARIVVYEFFFELAANVELDAFRFTLLSPLDQRFQDSHTTCADHGGGTRARERHSCVQESAVVMRFERHSSGDAIEVAHTFWSDGRTTANCAVLDFFNFVCAIVANGESER